MKNLCFGIILILFTITTISCKSEDESTVDTSSSTDPRTTTVSASLINIPSSVSAASSSSPSSVQSTTPGKSFSTAPSTEDAPVWGVYEGIRANIGAMEEWSEMISKLTASIYNTTGSEASGDWTNNSTDPTEPSRIVWGPDSVNGYDTKFEMYFSGVKGFEAYLTVDVSAETAKGIYTWDFTIAPNSDDPTSTAKVQFTFDSTAASGTKEMSIKVQDMSVGGTDQPTNAWLKVTQDTNNIINLWGNYYFPALGWFSDTTTEERSYVFATTGYDETGASATQKNMAVLQLALPPSDTATTDFWTSSSVSAIFVDKIKEIWIAEGHTIAGINTWTGLGLGAATVSVLTYSEVISILEWASNNPTDPNASDLNQLIHAIKMVNDAYFDATGFVGTCYDPGSDGTCDQGTATTVPTGYDLLDVDAVASDVVSPAAVKAMAISFL